MKILFLLPEENYTMHMHTKIPKRWAYLAEIATYVRNYGHDVDVIDCLNPKNSHGEVYTKIAKNNYDVIIEVARIESVRSILKISSTIKEISPQSKILIYGDIANYAQNIFKIDGVDAIVENGDWECAITDYIDFLEGKKQEDEIGGLIYRCDGEWKASKPGRAVENHAWATPDLNLVDHDLYLSITGGELTVSVSRGCPFNCHFCPAVITFKEKDRRKNPREIIDFIKAHRDRIKDFKLFSPTFTLDVDWVKEFCKMIIDEKLDIKWSSTTRPNCLKDEEMIKLMAESGCYKMAIGVETLDKESIKLLGKFDEDDLYEEIKKAFALLKKYGIKAKSLMMLGLEGQNAENIYSTFSDLEDWGADIRAASYSPRGLIKEKDKDNTLTLDFMESLDKMVYQDKEIRGLTRTQYLNLIYNTTNFRNIIKLDEVEYACE